MYFTYFLKLMDSHLMIFQSISKFNIVDLKNKPILLKCDNLKKRIECAIKTEACVVKR